MNREYLDSARSIHTERVTADGVVCNSPSLIFSICLESDQVNDGDATVYDGVSTKAPTLFFLTCTKYGVDFRAFTQPVVANRGIYVDIGDNVTAVVIQYWPFKE